MLRPVCFHFGNWVFLLSQNINCEFEEFLKKKHYNTFLGLITICPLNLGRFYTLLSNKKIETFLPKLINDLNVAPELNVSGDFCQKITHVLLTWFSQVQKYNTHKLIIGFDISPFIFWFSLFFSMVRFAPLFSSPNLPFWKVTVLEIFDFKIAKLQYCTFEK